MKWHGWMCGMVVAAGLSWSHGVWAQAENTAQRPADLLVFGGYQYTTPDYGEQHNNGITLGADYDRSFHKRVIPGLEFRTNLNSGPVVTEKSFLIGPRLHVNVARRFHPYADVQAGLGTIIYPASGLTIHDSGFVLAGGAGVDIDVARNFMFKADYQLQNWNLGQNAIVKPDGSNFTLGPKIFTVGVTYRIPFRRWVDSGHTPRY